MQQAVSTMLRMQDEMNTKVHTNWRSQGFDWYRAIWVEGAELLDHYGWKWWKKQQPDMEQVHLEIIDIWHFGLSELLQHSEDDGNLASRIASELQEPQGESDFRLQLEAFASETLNTKAFNIRLFAGLMAVADLSFDALYKGYVGKNVLNFFRQDNGYKEGTYIKMWSGREDNEYLVDAVNQLDISSGSFRDDVYKALESSYQQYAQA